METSFSVVRRRVQVCGIKEKTLEEIAEMVVTIEKLKAIIVKKDECIENLEKDLAIRTHINYDMALVSAIRRARERIL
jgi:hypothetical protein